MTDMVFTRHLNFLRKTLTDPIKIKKYLNQFSDDELYHTKQNMSNLLDDLIKDRESKHEELQKTKHKVIDLLKSSGLEEEEIENVLIQMATSQDTDSIDIVGRRRKFNKTGKFPVKYKAVTNDDKGNQIAYSWTGVGRRPKFFQGLNDEELEKYNILPEKNTKLPVMYEATEYKNGKKIIHTWSGVGNKSKFFSNLSPEEIEKYKVNKS